MISGPETITAHLNNLIEHLQNGDDDQARMCVHQVLFELQRLRATVPDRSKGGGNLIIAAVQMGIDVGKLNDLDGAIRSVLRLVDSDQLDAALEECKAAREHWQAPKGA